MRALVLLLLLSIGRASCGQPGSEPPLDSLVVCFTIAEAQAIGDTLWSRLDDRERRRIARAIMVQQAAAARNAAEESDRLRASFAPLVASEAEARRTAEAATEEALTCRLRAKGRGTRGFLVGLGLGVALTAAGLYVASGAR